MQRRLFANLSQLEMNYRGGSLSAHHSGFFSQVKVRAGDRTPDVVFTNAGQKISLFELIGRHGMIALLGRIGEPERKIIEGLEALHIRPFLIGPREAKEALTECLVDLHGDFNRLYGARSSFLYLIRPDGHVGFFQERPEPRALAMYLTKIRSHETVEKIFGQFGIR